MRMRYSGVIPVTFPTGNIGEVLPDEEFTVPDNVADSFISRPDMVVVPEDNHNIVPDKPGKRSKTALLDIKELSIENSTRTREG